MKRELEAALETRCVERIEALGGLALKLVIPGVRGFPDRTVLLPRKVAYTPKSPPPWEEKIYPANVAFMEFKRLKTGRISAQQHKWRVLLTQMGFGVYMIDTDAQFEEALAREMGR